jgi:hypothetical protein
MVFGFRFITGQAGTQKEWLDVTLPPLKTKEIKIKK